MVQGGYNREYVFDKVRDILLSVDAFLGTEDNVSYLSFSEIHDAAAKGKVDILKRCVEENHQDADEQDQAQNTPLHWAASTPNLIRPPLRPSIYANALIIGSGKDEAIKYLLEKGANINARNKLGDTALHRAVWRGHLSTVQILLDCPDIDVGILNHQGHMALDLARDPVIGELVQSYEAPDSPIEGRTSCSHILFWRRFSRLSLPFSLMRTSLLTHLSQDYIMEGYSDEDAPGAGTDEEGGSDTD
jgi:hypothetical protein